MIREECEHLRRVDDHDKHPRVKNRDDSHEPKYNRVICGVCDPPRFMDYRKRGV